MVERSKRSTSLKKKNYTTPGKKAKTSYKRKKSKEAFCSLCKKKLSGVITTAKSKTGKKPGRKFSGKLCHSCAEQAVKKQARIDSGQKKKQDIDMKYYKYLK